MTGKVYPKAFERYWKRAGKCYVGMLLEEDMKHLAFKAYRAGARHASGEHTRARAKYYYKKIAEKRSWV